MTDAPLAGRLECLALRARVLDAVREHFREQGFLEVDTPLLVRSPGVEVHLEPFVVPTRAGDLYLNTSPEYHKKRLLAAGAKEIFQLARAFRAGEAGDRHNPEFTLLEWYRPGGDHLAMLDDTHALLQAVADGLGVGPVLVWGGERVDLAAAPEVVGVEEAFVRYAGVAASSLTGPDRAERFSWLLADRVEPRLGRGRLTALTDWPADMASLARLSPDDPSVADRLEVYAAGLELANAFAELTDPQEQRRRMEAERRQRLRQGRSALPLDERFLASLACLPPCGGCALGIDRLVMLLAGEQDLRQVLAFPWEER